MTAWISPCRNTSKQSLLKMPKTMLGFFEKLIHHSFFLLSFTWIGFDNFEENCRTKTQTFLVNHSGNLLRVHDYGYPHTLLLKNKQPPLHVYWKYFIYNLKSNAVLNIPVSLLLKHLNQTFIDHKTEWELNMQSCEIGKRHKFKIF